VGLGSLHQVAVGDEFQIDIYPIQIWKVTITNVAPEYSSGRLELVWRDLEHPGFGGPQFPERNMDAALILTNATPASPTPQPQPVQSRPSR